jgi:hypothetical protein
MPQAMTICIILCVFDEESFNMLFDLEPVKTMTVRLPLSTSI